MATILNGFLPARKRDQHNHDRSLNTRWGDAAISAPMHGGWNTNSSQSESSPDLDRDLPPTPPQSHEEESGVFIVPDEDEEHHSGDEVAVSDRENVTITIPLPWKKKKVAHGRKPSHPPTNMINPRFAAPRRIDMMTPPPPPGSAEAAAIVPLPESRVASPIGRTATTSPALSFRARLASPSLAEILSPVAEGFAKDGPATRPAPFMSAMQASQFEPIERASSSSSIRSNTHRGYAAEGLGGGTMSSQATTSEQLPEYYRPPSRGIGATAHMRASSRGPRPPRSASVDPIAHRSATVDPVPYRAPSVEQYARRAPSADPYSRRGPSADPYSRRAPSVEPVGRRAPLVEPLRLRDDAEERPYIPAPLDAEPLRRRAPSVEPGRRRAPSVDPVNRRDPSVEPNRRREPSLERNNERAPSVGPRNTRRAASREPRGRRGVSVEPRQRVRFHSEVARRRVRDRGQDYSSDDDSFSDSDRGRDDSDQERVQRRVRFDAKEDNNRRPRRRRSIASPLTSPTVAAFSIAQISSMSPPPPPPPPAMQYDTIASRTAVDQLSPAPLELRGPGRNRSQSQVRGLYADMHNDFSMLARDVHNVAPAAPIVEPTPIITQLPRGILNVPSRTASPIVAPGATHLNAFSSTAGNLTSSDRNSYSSDTSKNSQASVSGIIAVDTDRYNDASGGRAMLAAVARERKDQLRREEREKAREKVARKLERERERVMAINALSDCESMNGASGNEMSRKVHTNKPTLDGNSQSRRGKTLVPDAEDIWG